MKRTLFKTRTYASLVVLLMTMPVWGNDGDTFTEETLEGALLTYTVISEAEKTCMVGEMYNWPVATTRANGVREVSKSQLSGDITIPEVANGYAVIRIEAFAFENTAITSVVIPNSVKDVGIATFIRCANLKSVRLSNQLKTINYATFQDCASLTRIDIPDGVISIGGNAFYGCRQLKEAVIPSSVEQFGDNVFYSAGFTSMPKLPEGLTTIPYGIFQSCPLSSVEIPQNITSIEGCAFNNCPISEIEIPASVTHIGEAAFARCKKLSSIVIPDNVSTIDYNAFIECSYLKKVTLSNNLSSLSSGIFSDCTNLESIIIPSGVKTIGKSAFEGCSSLTTITLPETLESIDNRAFFGCSSLTQLFIPKSVVSIKTENDWSLLYACNSLTSIIVDEDNPVYDSRNNSNAIIETANNKIIAGCTTTTIPEGITTIGSWAFCGFQNLTSITLPQSLKSIEGGAFNRLGLKEISIPENVTSIGSYAFCNCTQLETVKSYIKDPYEISENAFYINHSSIDATLYVPKGTVDKYKATKGWNIFSTIIENTEPDVTITYRSFVEEGKVWKVGVSSNNPVQQVDYFYFDGDTIINGKACKQMMCQRYVTPDYADYEIIMQHPLLMRSFVWYEEDKKVYTYDNTNKRFMLAYDFSLNAYDTLQIANYYNRDYILGPRQTGGIKGFKGVYRDVLNSCEGEYFHNITWLEGVGSIEGPTWIVYLGKEYHGGAFLMSCTVGDEVIYFNDEYEDGATPAALGARKQRIDFTHTIKTKPKAPRRIGTRANSPAEEGLSLYGEYSNLQLDINLNPLDDDYLVRITDETGKAVYEKAVNAGNIVGLNIDISSYAEGRYQVTVENGVESFTGEFDVQTTEIVDVRSKRIEVADRIYNLQGQRISSLQKGLNIVNGQKVFVK